MPNIQAAVQWAINTANDDTHGYDQANRYGPDYDCSSFVAAALIAGGFNVPATMWTGNEHQCLLNAGFRDVAIDAPRQAGDIFIIHYTNGPQHTFMCINSTQIVEAAINENGGITGGQTGDQTGQEIWITNFYNFGVSWSYHMRYGRTDIVNPKWNNKTYGAYDMYSTEAQENAVMAYSILQPRGWTLNAFCGLWANVGYEGGYNPWRWESDIILTSTDTTNMQSQNEHGYGLFQFTPSANYCLSQIASSFSGYGPNFSDKTGSTNDGTAQLIYVDTQPGYYTTTQYPMTFSDYKKSAQSAADLAEIWLYNYERPANPSATLSDRRTAASYWYSVLQGITFKRKSMPVWMMLRNTRRI